MQGDERVAPPSRREARSIVEHDVQWSCVSLEEDEEIIVSVVVRE
jgi:hypothetical protein